MEWTQTNPKSQAENSALRKQLAEKDLCLKKIVGYAFSSHIDTNLIVSALEMAVNRQKPQENLIFHSDRGVQYASGGYREAWNKCGRLSKTKERLRFIPFFVAFLCPFLLGWHN